MQSGRRSGCLGGRGEKLGKGLTSAVEALEQWALTSMGSCQVGSEGGAPLLQSGSGATEVRFAPRGARLGATWGAGANAGTLWDGAAVKVRSQGSPPVDTKGNSCLAWAGCSLGGERGG